MAISIPSYLDEKQLLGCCLKTLQQYSLLPTTKNACNGDVLKCPTCTATLVYRPIKGWTVEGLAEVKS